MMKTKNLLLALCSVAALASCTNDDEPAVAPAQRALTLSVEVAEPADTRVAYTQDGTTYKFAWASGDVLRVFYKDGEDEKHADFMVDATTIAEGKADFKLKDDETFPADYSGTVTITYSPDNYYVGSPENSILLDGSADATTLTEALKKRTILYAENVAVTGGQLPAVKLNHVASYLLLKMGLQVVSGSASVADGTKTYLQFNNVPGMYLDCYATQATLTTGYISPILTFDTDGKLDKDYLLPLPMKESTEVAIQVQWSLYKGSWKYGTSVTQKSRTYTPGVIYEVSASSTEWQAAPLPAVE